MAESWLQFSTAILGEQSSYHTSKPPWGKEFDAREEFKIGQIQALVIQVAGKFDASLQTGQEFIAECR
ncbi:MAG: hypothetical protein H6684_09595 [Deltaproteobacteria bacterium]|nr:hypothetical protein [bacterium]MCB9477717.1 hypothetical protein [Deltaproteobacteria bacterium]MCB9479386.1 hypothetical protein [Deltaproteobacteria bacterium]MCB9488970.1 hypothetical protein [Deltaproteobacteria bacterium]